MPGARVAELGPKSSGRSFGEWLLAEDLELALDALTPFAHWITPAVLPTLRHSLQSLDGVRIHVSGGGNMAFVSLPAPDQAAACSERLGGLALSAVTLRGEAPLWCGTQPCPQIAHAVKHALDPENRFPGLDE